jgi:hypothetical protein
MALEAPAQMSPDEMGASRKRFRKAPWGSCGLLGRIGRVPPRACRFQEGSLLEKLIPIRLLLAGDLSHTGRPGLRARLRLRYSYSPPERLPRHSLDDFRKRLALVCGGRGAAENGREGGGQALHGRGTSSTSSPKEPWTTCVSSWPGTIGSACSAPRGLPAPARIRTFFLDPPPRASTMDYVSVRFWVLVPGRR